MLQLRERLDTVLDNVGLDTLHLDRQDKIGTPVLLTQCGKPVLTIQGVTLPARLNSKERDYVYRILSNYIQNNLDDILWIMKASKERIDLNNISKYNISHRNTYGSFSNKDAYKFSLVDSFLIHCIYVEEKNHYEMYTPHGVTLNDVLASLKNIEEYKKELRIYYEAFREQTKVDEKIARLSTCTV